MEYTSTELLIINASRLLRDYDRVFVGVGIPNLACNLAMRTHAPHLLMIYEAGVIGARPSRLPLIHRGSRPGKRRLRGLQYV